MLILFVVALLLLTAVAVLGIRALFRQPRQQQTGTLPTALQGNGMRPQATRPKPPGKFRKWIKRQFRENGRALAGRAFLLITLPALYVVRSGWWFIIFTLAGLLVYVYTVAKTARGQHYDSLFGWLFEKGKKKRLAGVTFSYSVLVLAEVCGGQLTWILQQTPARGLFGVFLLAIFYLTFSEVFTEEVFVRLAKNSFKGYVILASAGLLMILFGWFGREYFRTYWMAALAFAILFLWCGKGAWQRAASNEPASRASGEDNFLDGRQLKRMAFGVGIVILGSMLITFLVDTQPFADRVWDTVKERVKARIEHMTSKTAPAEPAALPPAPPAKNDAPPEEQPITSAPSAPQPQARVEKDLYRPENIASLPQSGQKPVPQEAPQTAGETQVLSQPPQPPPVYAPPQTAPTPAVATHRKPIPTIWYGVRTLYPLSRLNTCTEGMRLANACK